MYFHTATATENDVTSIIMLTLNAKNSYSVIIFTISPNIFEVKSFVDFTGQSMAMKTFSCEISSS